jgi:glycerol-3-phosphate dehydrogenase
VADALQQVIRLNSPTHIRLIKGSHIVVPRLFDHDRAYIFQNADDRIVFAIPYEDDFTLIGTTDEDYEGDPARVAISEKETDYLCAAASEYFKAPITRDQIVWTYSGVRPLFDDGASAAQEATRDYVLKVDGDAATGAVVNVFGGKLTTSRRLSEAVLEKIEAVLGKRGEKWTSTAKLPGGEFAPTGFEAEVEKLQKAYPRLPSPLLRRLTRLYGTRARTLLDKGRTRPEQALQTADIGIHFGADLYQAEVDYLVANEWARTADDILWRRTKLGLRVSNEDKSRLAAYLAGGL